LLEAWVPAVVTSQHPTLDNKTLKVFLSLSQLRVSDNLTENAKESADSMYNQHMLVCAFQEIGCLLLSLGTTASSIMVDTQSGNLI